MLHCAVLLGEGGGEWAVTPYSLVGGTRNVILGKVLGDTRDVIYGFVGGIYYRTMLHLFSGNHRPQYLQLLAPHISLSALTFLHAHIPKI